MKPNEDFDQARQSRLEALWQAAVSSPAAERPALLAAMLSDDEALRQELESLLSNAESGESFFGRFPRLVNAVAGEAVDQASDGHAAASDGVDGQRQSEETVDPLVGRMTGLYYIEARLGAGGMGVVYRALDVRLRRTVALKLLAVPSAMDTRAAERLLVEARAAASLDHPNICTVYEVGELEGGPFIAMAYYPGETLAQRLRGRALPWQEALRIAAQITRGLSAAHQRGIVHRDVKPANVLITVDGTVKLLDFGIARVPEVHLTGPGFAPGTLAYMSPEQITSGACDQRSDLWSLGVLLHELCTGEQPFRGSTTPALLTAIVGARPTLPSSLRPEIPAVVDRIVVRLLQKDADARYASASALLRDLERALQTAHESSHPPTEPGTPASVELLSRRETLATPSGGTAPVAGPRRRWMQPSAIGAVVVATLGIVGWLLTRDRFGVDPDRVAVVPFVYRSGADSLQLGTILGELVTNELTAASVVVAPFVNVLAASAQLERAGMPGDLNAIAHETRAGIIVTGSYFLRPAGDSLSIQAIVHDVRRDRPLTSVDLVTVPVADPLQGIDAVLQRVLVVLSSRLNPQLAQIAPLVDLPMNMEAYREYAAGLERSGVDDYPAALKHFYAAIRLDSTSASALNEAALTEWLATGNLPKVDSFLLTLARYKRDLQPYELARHDWLRAWLDGNLMGSLLATREMSRLSGHMSSPHAQDALKLNFLDEAHGIRKELKTPYGRTSTWTYQHLTDVLHRRGKHRAEYRQARKASEEIGETRNTLFSRSRPSRRWVQQTGCA